MALKSGITEALFDIVGSDHVWLRAGWSQFDVTGSRRRIDADAVVFPRTTQEVAALIRGAAACEIPVIAVPALSEYGKMWCHTDGIVLALNRMNKVLEVDTERCRARVQPAVTASRLVATAAVAGASCSADGRYSLLEFEAVLPTGEVVRADKSTNFAGVITELTIDMRPNRRNCRVRSVFGRMKSVGRDGACRFDDHFRVG